MNVKSEYNLDSIIKVKDYIRYQKKQNKNYIMISDDGTLHHLYETVKISKENKMKPIIGTELYEMFNDKHSITIFPRNKNGCKALIVISSLYNSEHKPTWDALKKHLKNMNVVINTEKLEIDELLHFMEEIKQHLQPEQIYLGLKEKIENGIFIYQEKNNELIELAKKMSINFIRFNDIYFLEDKDLKFANLYRKIKGEEEIDIENGLENQERIFEYIEEEDGLLNLINNTSSDFFDKETEMKLPDITPNNIEIPEVFMKRYNDWAKNKKYSDIKQAYVLFERVIKETKKRFGNNKNVLEDVLKELDTIIKKSFAPYFLNVANIIEIGKKNNVIFGPGRGSVVGATSAFLLNITTINPRLYKLQFERFLNEFRTDYPDIDIDVSKETREILLEKIREFYGETKVAQIMTKNNFGSKVALKNITEIYQYPQELIDELIQNNIFDFEDKESFLKSLHYKKRNKLTALADGRELIDFVFKLRTLPKSLGVHAAGIVISDDYIHNIVPTFQRGNVLITQITNDYDSLENLGLTKIDVLSVEYLDLLQKVKQEVGKKYDFIPKNSQEVLDKFRKGELCGVFQMESEGMMRTSQNIGINSFEDVVVLNAIYRPGPMSIIPQYVDAKNSEKIFIKNIKGEIIPGTEELIPILKETRGFIIYQEQINQIVRVWANYNLAQAEMFRRIISDKNKEGMQQVKEQFIKKSLENNRDKKATQDLIELIERFSDYGYNKSHAVAYAQLAYEGAFLKTKHPLVFYKHLLKQTSDITKKRLYFNEIKNQNIKVVDLDINNSPIEYEIINNALHIGLTDIKGVGLNVAEKIVRERNVKKFESYEDVKNRIGENIANELKKYKQQFN